MGNVAIPCCRSRPADMDDGSNRESAQYSNDQSRSKRYFTKLGPGTDQDVRSQPTNNLQHISEREPDDSEIDPSSNPLDRPIFAARISLARSRNSTYNDSYSSNNSTSKKFTNTLLTSSQDNGYNSGASTNLTQYDGQLNCSFDSSVNRSNQLIKDQLNQSANDTETGSKLFSPIISSHINVDASISLEVKQCEVNLDSIHSSRIAKASSCSTIYIDDSTISQPDLNQIIKCVSLAIYYHVNNITSNNSSDIFDECIHPVKMPETCSVNIQEDIITPERNEVKQATSEPDFKVIHCFVKSLFKSAQLTSEYAITALVYLERLMTYAEMDLTTKTWRRMFLGSILLSSKVWEDQAVWNVDYAQILEEVSVEDINELERQFLELIEFNMNVPSSVYAKYYFHLRTLALKNGLSGRRDLLTIGRARQLEAMSRTPACDWQASPIHRKSSPVIKRYTSLEKLRLNGLSSAILM